VDQLFHRLPFLEGLMRKSPATNQQHACHASHARRACIAQPSRAAPFQPCTPNAHARTKAVPSRHLVSPGPSAADPTVRRLRRASAKGAETRAVTTPIRPTKA
jgi:hypothetical protein